MKPPLGEPRSQPIAKSAAAAVPLHPLLAERWSPRGFDTTHELTRKQLLALLEAARWAPSASNTQPWRFAVATRGTVEFEAVLTALARGNQAWAHAASGFIIVAAETTSPDGSPRPWAVYDTGQAVAHLSVQAEHEGLAVHQLGGFDRDRLTDLLALPSNLTPLVVVAIGQRDAGAQLPEPLAVREAAARERRPLIELLIPTVAAA
jgi:nitroreductase